MASVFKTNRTQAIRLPKALALPENVKSVDVVAMGNSRLIKPLGGAWDSWFEQPAAS
nr:type II toxin-antitoxin system VapB family antitoxin [Orrella daihaiensis]